MPTELATMSEHAWNPISSDAEIGATNNSEQDARQLDLVQVPKHVLLNTGLAGKHLKVFITDANGKTKESTINIHYSGGDCSMRITQYHTSIQVDPKTVTPKHPSPTHDNGLVIIIEGIHTGKHGRRLYHAKKDGQGYMILEVVTVQDGQQDIPTGAILELSPHQLCVVDESVKQKKLNKDVMKGSREAYRTQLKLQGR